MNHFTEILRDYLDEYIKKYPKIKVIRSHRRLGIVSNRMLGAANAKGPIIVYVNISFSFLRIRHEIIFQADSHIEVAPRWLEPLLERFTKDMTVLVYPKLTGINPDTLKFAIENKRAGSIGGFTWGLDFTWIDTKWYEGDHPTEMWEPKRSPIMFGAIRAISKKFFLSIGMLDPDFDIWGGDDVAMSFKVWLCGGSIEFVPCSSAAHMFKEHKYKVTSLK